MQSCSAHCDDRLPPTYLHLERVLSIDRTMSAVFVIRNSRFVLSIQLQSFLCVTSLSFCACDCLVNCLLSRRFMLIRRFPVRLVTRAQSISIASALASHRASFTFQRLLLIHLNQRSASAAADQLTLAAQPRFASHYIELVSASPAAADSTQSCSAQRRFSLHIASRRFGACFRSG